MSSIDHPDDVTKKLDGKSEQIDAKATLNKRLIWQHLAQKKIKKIIKSKLKINSKKIKIGFYAVGTNSAILFAALIATCGSCVSTITLSNGSVPDARIRTLPIFARSLST